MVFKRRGGFRKFRKFRRFRRKLNPGVLALKKIKKMIQMKYLDIFPTAGIASDAPHIAQITNVAQGAGDDQRVGDQILVHSIHLRCVYSLSADLTGILRSLVVIDRQQIADTDPTMSNLLQSADVAANLNKNTAGRFQVLSDVMKSFMPPSADVNTKWVFNKYIKFRKPLSVRFNGILGSDIQKNGIYIMQISDRTAASGDIDQNMQIRLGFTDG